MCEIYWLFLFDINKTLHNRLLLSFRIDMFGFVFYGNTGTQKENA